MVLYTVCPFKLFVSVQESLKYRTYLKTVVRNLLRECPFKRIKIVWKNKARQTLTKEFYPKSEATPYRGAR